MPLKLNLTRPHTVAVLVALSMATSAAAQDSRGDKLSQVHVDIARIHIDNFGRINSNYFRGAQPKDRDYSDLAALGIKTLINLTSDDAQANEQAMAAKAGLRYVQIPMNTHIAPKSEEIAQFLKIVNDPANQPVYVHCVGGRHRTGVMTAAYRISQNGWTAEQAFKEMKQYKFGADFLHPEFKQFVFDYPALASVAASQQTH